MNKLQNKNKMEKYFVNQTLDFHIISTICKYLKDIDLNHLSKGILNKTIQRDLLVRLNSMFYYVFVYTSNDILEVYNLLSYHTFPEYALNMKNILFSPVILVLNIKDIVFQHSNNKNLVYFNIGLECIVREYTCFSKIQALCKIDDDHFAAATANEIKVFQKNNSDCIINIKQLGITCMDYCNDSFHLIIGYRDGSIKFSLYDPKNEYNLNIKNMIEPIKDHVSNKDLLENQVTDYYEFKSVATSVKSLGKNLAASCNEKGYISLWSLKNKKLRFSALVNSESKLTKMYQFSCNFQIFKSPKTKFTEFISDNYYSIIKVSRLLSKRVTLDNNTSNIISYYGRIIYSLNKVNKITITKHFDVKEDKVPIYSPIKISNNKKSNKETKESNKKFISKFDDLDIDDEEFEISKYKMKSNKNPKKSEVNDFKTANCEFTKFTNGYPIALFSLNNL